ncbi:MAG TPA: cohesin domain-containing protein [Candidatus Paceibacterota bacterium]
MAAIKKILISISLPFLLWSVTIETVQAARLLLSPPSGTFAVGSIFETAVFLDTEKQAVNMVDATIIFPPDKLQLVSPTTGQSVISVWTAAPIFNNQTGTIRLSGGIPGGLNVNRGLITNLTFRVKQVGEPVLVKFSNDSQILANDGRGTAVLGDVQNGVYKLILPPPAGPIVSSETHPDQARWYPEKNIIFRWTSLDPVEQYSYVLSRDPVENSDGISEGKNNSAIYKNLVDGTHYFHIKSLHDGIWGGVTHFAVNVDTAPPAEFPIDISPAERTSSKRQFVSFTTTDTQSGLDHYEMKVVNLTANLVQAAEPGESFFIETVSPHALALDFGTYDVIVRAYDQAGNFREITKRLKVVNQIFEIVTGQGVKISRAGIIPWFWFWLLMIILIAGLGFLAWRVSHWHRQIATRRENKELPKELKSKLSELKRYRQKYGQLLLFIVLIGSLLTTHQTSAEIIDSVQLAPPFVSSVSRDLSNKEIFYIGGKTDVSNVTVLIYLQNLQTGETFSAKTVSDTKRDWFYRHQTFLTPGDYLLWNQSQLGEVLSPPSAQIKMTVQQTAIQFGASRLSYETLYLLIALGFLLIISGLIIFLIYHIHQGRKKQKLFAKEFQEAEESIRRGFAVLRRDLEAELKLVRRLNPSETEKQRELQLLEDLNSVQQHIGQEVWDIEKALE